MTSESMPLIYSKLVSLSRPNFGICLDQEERKRKGIFFLRIHLVIVWHFIILVLQHYLVTFLL